METPADYAAWVLRPSLPEQPTRPSRSYVVCSTPRGGSWLLCGLLASTGVAGRPHEWFSPETERPNRRAWGVSSFAEYVARVREAGTTPNGVFGAKLMAGHRDDFVARLKEVGHAPSDAALIARHFPSPSFVWLRREDVVGQAVSWAKAIQTGRWHHWDPGHASASPRYDRRQVDALVRELEEADAGWRSWFGANGLQPVVVRFEDLVEDTVGRAREVLAFLGVGADGVGVAELTVGSRDRVDAEWIARFRSGR